jgi:hypothetical protein
MKAIALLLALMLAACGTSPPADPPPTAKAQPTQPAGWKAVLIAGDDKEPAFDNAIDSMAEKLKGFGVPGANIVELKATQRGPHEANAANIRGAFVGLNPAASDGCFVFITSHGARGRGLVMKRTGGFLTPGDLGTLLDGTCRGRPTVVIASGCFSGSFAEGTAMPAPNRTILTAARDDRPSFGCNASLHYTVFDRCILENLNRGMAWPAVMAKTRACVITGERQFRVDAPSEPQMYIGDAVPDLLTFGMGR